MKRLVVVLAALCAALMGVVMVPATVSAAEPGVTTLLFVRGVDDGVWFRSLDQATGVWGPWQGLGGVVTGTPHSALMPNGSIAVFARGADGAVWTRSTFDLVSWSGWTSLGGQVLDDPLPVVPPWQTTTVGEADLALFARGVDNRLWFRKLSHVRGTWSGWIPWSPPELTGPIGNVWTDPASKRFNVAFPVASSQCGNGQQGMVYMFDALLNSSWNVPLGGCLTASPVVVGGLRTARAFGRTVNNGLGVAGYAGQGVYWWADLGGVLADAPHFGPIVDNAMTAVVQGADNGMWWFAPDRWIPLGGLVPATPSGDYADATKFLLTARGIDNAVWIRWRDDSSKRWSDWAGLGGAVRGEPSQLSIVTTGASKTGLSTDQAHWSKAPTPDPPTR